MKNLQYLLLIICISLAKGAFTQNKIAHFDWDLVLRKMAANRQALASWKRNSSITVSNASDAPARISVADSLTVNSIFLKVMKDWNYQYVFNPDYLLATPASSNLTNLVAKQLRIEITDSNSCDVTVTKRFGYCNRDSILAQLPEKRVIDSLLASYQNDSLSMEYDNLLAEFQRYDSWLKTEYCMSVRQPNKQNTFNNFAKLQNWFDYSSKKMQARQFLLLKPYYVQIDNAIKRLAEQDGFDYIFKDNFHYQGVKDISSDVIKELELCDEERKVTLRQ